jgi:outer membrane protein assembly factor BamB
MFTNTRCGQFLSVSLLCLSIAVTSTLSALAAEPSAVANEWPEFRGPDGQGHATQRGLPLSWSESENIFWKAPIDGLGWSSPVISGQQVWLTTATDEGKSLRAVCLNRETGKIEHNIDVFQPAEPGKIHKKNSHASPTPLIEGDFIYIHFGTHGTACLTKSGKIVWKNNELKYKPVHGSGCSPVLVDDLLIVNCDGEDLQFVVAIEKATGKIRWKTDRDGLVSVKHFAFATPLAIRVGNSMQVVSPGPDQVVSYDPKSGKPLWHSRYKGGYSLVPRPVFGNGLIYVCSGYDSPVMYAIRPDGQGDVTETHVAWSVKKGVPHNPSPLLIGGELYMVADRGVATCLDAKTGEEIWQERLGGNFSSSPLFADGRIYFLNEEGGTTVIAPGREFKELSKNQVEGRTLASFSVAGRAIYLRTDTHLYRIESK